MQLTRETRMLLEDLEERICPETEDDFIRQWRVFLAGEFSGEIFCPVRNRMTAPGYQQEPVHINDVSARTATSSVHAQSRDQCMRAT